jgi:hypothetical protein
MSTIIVSGSSPSTISVSIPQVNTIVVTPPEVRTISATLNIGNAGTPGQGVEAGGTTGQSLVKLNDNDYATTWADRLAAVVEDTSPELGGDLNTAGNAITFEDEGGVAAGSLAYDVDESTVAYTNALGVSIELGEKSVFYGKAAEDISKGDVVMFGGVQGNHLLLKKADQQASGFIPEWVIGFAAQDLDTNDFGYVVWFGKLDGLSGYDTATYSDGDLLYLDPATPGAVRLSEPTPPNHSILLAAVLTPSNGSSGRIIIRPTHKPDTDEVPEGSTNLYFTDARAQAAVETFKDTDITFSTPTRTADLQTGGRLVFRDDSNQNILYLEESTRRVGVSTPLGPTATLDVDGDAKISSNLTVGGGTIALSDTAVLGVADTERFTIGSLSGTATLTMNATTGFTNVTTFSSGLKIEDTTNYIQIEAPTLSSSYTLTLPADDGNANDVLTSDGSGNLSWAAPVTDTIYTANGTLSGNRAIEMGTSSIDFTSSSTTVAKITNAGLMQATGRMAINGNTAVGGTLRLADANNSSYLQLQAPAALSSNFTLVLPTADGTSGQVLQTDGSGNLSFTSGSADTDVGPWVSLGGRFQVDASDGNQMMIAGGAFGPYYYIWSQAAGATLTTGTVDTSTTTMSSFYQLYGGFKLPSAKKVRANFAIRNANANSFSKNARFQMYSFSLEGVSSTVSMTLRADYTFTSPSGTLPAEHVVTTTSAIPDGDYVICFLGMNDTMLATGYFYMNIQLELEA